MSLVVGLIEEQKDERACGCCFQNLASRNAKIKHEKQKHRQKNETEVENSVLSWAHDVDSPCSWRRPI